MPPSVTIPAIVARNPTTHCSVWKRIHPTSGMPNSVPEMPAPGMATGKIGVFGIGKISMHGYQEMNWRNFAPRLGVAYQLTQKTVVRAGYGWAYELGTFGSIFGHNVTQNIP